MKTREEWLTARRTGIGGSDIAALLGINPWKTPVDLWMDKTGRTAESQPDDDQLERMHWGNVLEAAVAAEYASRTGARVQRINDMLRHPRYPAALANIDRAIVADGSRARWDDATGRVLGASGLLECKTAHALAASSADWGDAGTDEVPMHYWMQVQWYLAITGLPHGDLAVLFGGQKFKTYRIESDASMQGDLLARAQEWWTRHVESDMPPEPASEADARALWRAHRPGVEKIVQADVARAVDELLAIKAQIGNENTEGTLEHRMRELRDIVCTAFGEAEAITYMGRKLATWKANKPSLKIDWRAIAAELEPATELVAAHTTEPPGARVLRLTANKE